MKKHSNCFWSGLRFILVFIIVMGMFADRVMAKNVTGNQMGRWRLNESPYIITGNITIPLGETLIVEPGVIIKFAGFYRMKVQGTLIAKGTTKDKIIFTSSKDFEFGTTENADVAKLSPKTNDWDLIEFLGDNNKQSSELAFCIIRYSAGIIQVKNTSPTLKRIQIVDCHSNQVYVNGTMQAITQGREIDISTLHANLETASTSEDELYPFAETEEFTFGEIMVISAARREQKIGESPSTISVITAEDIANSGAKTLYELIQRVPGVNSLHLGFNKPADIRSSTVDGRTNRILILVNGAPWNPPSTGSLDDLSQGFTLINVERIEIIRGPGSSLYGTNAFNGVINIITRKAGSIKGVHTEANYGSFNQTELKFTAGNTINDYSFLVNFRGLTSSGPKNYQSEITGNYVNLQQAGVELQEGSSVTTGDPNNNMQLKGIHISGETKYKHLNFFGGYDRAEYGNYGRDILSTVNAMIADPNTGLPTPVSFTQSNALDHSGFDTEVIFGDLKYSMSISSVSDLMLRAYTYRHNQHVELLNQSYTPYWEAFIPAGLPNKIIFSEEHISYDVHTSLNIAEVQFNITPSTNNHLIAGLEFRNTDAKSNTFLEPDKKYVQNSIAIYAEDEWKIGSQYVLVGGFRYDKHFDYAGVLSPRASFLVKINSNLTARTSHGWAFRAPNFANLYANANLGMFKVLANEDLRPETIKTTEIALDYRTSKFSTSATGFFSQQRDLIGYRSGNISSGSMMPDIIQLNVGIVDVMGMELDLKANITHELSSYLNYTFQHIVYGDIDDDKGFSLKNEPVEYVPAHKINWGFNWKPVPRLTLNANIHYTSEMPFFNYVDIDGISGPPFTYKRSVDYTDSYLNANAQVRYSIIKSLDLFVFGINLFDATIEQQLGYPIPGRQIHVGICFQNIIN